MEITRLIKVLYRLIELQEQVLVKLDYLSTSKVNHEEGTTAPTDLMDSVEIKSILKISDSTLYRLKRNKQIATIKIGKRFYYSLSQTIVAIKKRSNS